MKIAFISPEVYPFAKTGGLADVSYALPKALAKAGHDVSVFMPRYKSVAGEKFGLKLTLAPLIVRMGTEDKYAAVLASDLIPGVKVLFIDYEMYFGREGLYGYPDKDFGDNAERFDFFARAVIEGIKAVGFCPDIIHCNDWQTGLIPYYIKKLYSKDDFFKHISIVMTVHNAGYQGIFSEYSLPGPKNNSCFNNEDIDYPKKINFLKLGLLHSDAVTTVSKRYAEEIQTHEFGYDLAGLFRSMKDRLYGIPNAVDYETWDPARDKLLPCNYSTDDLSGKTGCKLELQKRMGLPADPGIPLLGTISRLAYQKGMDILADTMEILLQDEKFQFVIMGSGEKLISHRYDNIKRMFPRSVGVFSGYDEEMEHLAEAGLDILIMPSRYEPCGLNQIYSLKYGTVPVVRATGGLDEAVTEWDEQGKTGNGFKFAGLSEGELYNVIRKVINKFRKSADWYILQRNGMGFSYSWDDAVREYEKVYAAAQKL